MNIYQPHVLFKNKLVKIDFKILGKYSLERMCVPKNNYLLFIKLQKSAQESKISKYHPNYHPKPFRQIQLPIMQRNKSRKKNVWALFNGSYTGVVDMIDTKRKQKFSEIEEIAKTYNEVNIVLDTYNGAQMVHYPNKKSTLFLLDQRYLTREAFVRLDRWKLVAAFGHECSKSYGNF